MALTILWLGLSTGACILGLGLTWWLHQHHQIGVAIPATSAALAWPLISIIVPARNEARNIRRCVAGLLAQAYPHLELIVVDDHSTDETPLILAELARADSRLTVIPGVPLPGGWVGKPHALTQGAEAAQGEWLCFVDADTFAAPDLLVSTALFLPGWLALGVLWLGAGGGGPAAIVLLQALITWASVLFSRVQVARSFGLSDGYALILPLGALIFGAMMFTSAFKVLSGRGVIWKGRTYADY